MTYSWYFITAPDGIDTVTIKSSSYSETITGSHVPSGGYIFTTTSFEENEVVTISAVGYSRVTAIVGGYNTYYFTKRQYATDDDSVTANGSQTIINLINEPNTSVSANITDSSGNIHSVDVKLRTIQDGSLVCDMRIDDVDIFYGRRCINRMPLLFNNAIEGNFYFYDLYENADPQYTGFNSRWVLVYDTEFSLK